MNITVHSISPGMTADFKEHTSDVKYEKITVLSRQVYKEVYRNQITCSVSQQKNPPIENYPLRAGKPQARKIVTKIQLQII